VRCCHWRNFDIATADRVLPLSTTLLLPSAGGFLRLTLVHPKDRYNHAAHARNSWRWSCWSAGEENCPNRSKKECGTDQAGRRYRQQVTIPPVFPDGRYILGFSWYGGTSLQGTYWSCADVRIQGGPLQKSYQPQFVNHHNGSCKNNANALGQCTREPCKRRVQWGPPKEFEHGRRPRALHSCSVRR